MGYLLKFRTIICLFGALCLLFCFVQTSPTIRVNKASLLENKNIQANNLEEKPEKVTICNLKKDPATYNHKLVEITGFIAHGFEEFTIFDPTCSSRPSIWLEYGGSITSGTVYCCGVSPKRNRAEILKIEDIPINLIDDKNFQEFDKLLQKQPGSVVYATVVGRFFSGEKIEYPAGVFFGGYGHMGCCTLLAIQQILTFEPHNSKNLDYTLSADQPNIEKVGCGYKHLLDLRSFKDLIETQKKAENDSQTWIFDDPNQVASNFLINNLNLDKELVKQVRITRRKQGRIVYKLLSKLTKKEYMVVVSRPYWLSFYSKNRERVAWVVIAAYESSCKSDNSVRLIHKGRKS